MIIERAFQEKREREFLAKYALRSENTAGREHPEPECKYRTAFQRDRDRIIHSKAFRRLEYKTQVFAYYEGDHYRTRLTHTLEVAQVARSIAQYLGANEELTHAVALAHDLGHTPFGHAGEAALQEVMADYGGFEHNMQSLRVVEKLETRYPDFPGLNLTFETRCGIIRHTSTYDKAPQEAMEQFSAYPQPSLEAQIVNLADEIAYNCHDIEDGLRSGYFQSRDLEELELWNEVTKAVSERRPDLDSDMIVYQCIRALIDMLIRDMIEATEERLSSNDFKSAQEIMAQKNPVAVFSETMREKKDKLNHFLFTRFYTHFKIMRMQFKAARLLKDLFREFSERPSQLPPQVQKRLELKQDSVQRIVCDHIAGMTDRFALNEHRTLFLPYEY